MKKKMRQTRKVRKDYLICRKAENNYLICHEAEKNKYFSRKSKSPQDIQWSAPKQLLLFDWIAFSFCYTCHCL